VNRNGRADDSASPWTEAKDDELTTVHSRRVRRLPVEYMAMLVGCRCAEVSERGGPRRFGAGERRKKQPPSAHRISYSGARTRLTAGPFKP